MKVTKPRVDSETACTKARTQQLGEHRHLISGGSELFQLWDEVKACTPAEQGPTFNRVADQALALKADLNIPWAKLGVVRR